MSRPFDPLPFIAGLGLIAAGAALRRWRSSRLDLPAPGETPRLPRATDPADIARQTRETLAAATPDNIGAALGRTLVVMGAGLVVVRALDELEERDAL